MKRTGFPGKPARPAKQMDSYTPRPRDCSISDGKARATVPVPRPKARPERSAEYLRLVAAMPCAVCCRPGPSQACHADEGKGMAVKSDDRTAWPGCADGPDRRGCHTLMGSTGLIPRDMRREFEAMYGKKTRAAIELAGAWPAKLPKWGTR